MTELTFEQIDSMPAGRETRQALIDAGLWDSKDERDPSQDITAAWQVLEKFKADGWAVEVQWEIMDGGGDWFCALDNSHKEWYGFAETAMLAICRAALKAVVNV